MYCRNGTKISDLFLILHRKSCSCRAKENINVSKGQKKLPHKHSVLIWEETESNWCNIVSPVIQLCSRTCKYAHLHIACASAQRFTKDNRNQLSLSVLSWRLINCFNWSYETSRNTPSWLNCDFRHTSKSLSLLALCRCVKMTTAFYLSHWTDCQYYLKTTH